MNGGKFVAMTSDGTDTKIEVDGDHITRSLSYGGVDVPTELQVADYSDALGAYETVNQDLSPKIDRME